MRHAGKGSDFLNAPVNVTTAAGPFCVSLPALGLLGEVAARDDMSAGVQVRLGVCANRWWC